MLIRNKNVCICFSFCSLIKYVIYLEKKFTIYLGLSDMSSVFITGIHINSVLYPLKKKLMVTCQVSSSSPNFSFLSIEAFTSTRFRVCEQEEKEMPFY